MKGIKKHSYNIINHSKTMIYKFLFVLFVLCSNQLQSLNKIHASYINSCPSKEKPFWKNAYLSQNYFEKQSNKHKTLNDIPSKKQGVKFIENKGQMMDVNHNPVSFVLFKASAPGMDVYITEKGLTYVFVKMNEDEKEEHNKESNPNHEDHVKIEQAWVNVSLKGASIKRENIVKEIESSDNQNYFYGHCAEGIYNVKSYEKITIANIYPGVDWVFYNSTDKGMKYDFIVHPGADPNQIKLVYESAKQLNLDAQGNITIKTPLGTLIENAPYSYIKETQTEVNSKFIKTVIDKHQVQISFNIQTSFTENKSQNYTLIIDPQLVWLTTIVPNPVGAAGTTGIDCDAVGNVFIIGYTDQATFPLLNPSGGAYYQASLGGGGLDGFIMKFNGAGSLLWSTYYGGSAWESFNSLVCDPFGNVFITGYTQSSNFPVFNNIGMSYSGAYYQSTNPASHQTAFILKFWFYDVSYG